MSGYYFVRIRNLEGTLLGFLDSNGNVVRLKTLAARISPSSVGIVKKVILSEGYYPDFEFVNYINKRHLWIRF